LLYFFCFFFAQGKTNRGNLCRPIEMGPQNETGTAEDGTRGAAQRSTGRVQRCSGPLDKPVMSGWQRRPLHKKRNRCRAGLQHKRE
jgi:hypothetical protein